MRHIISLQRHCADNFSDIYDDGDLWISGSDPETGKVGSGGGTAWSLYQAYLNYADASALDNGDGNPRSKKNGEAKNGAGARSRSKTAQADFYTWLRRNLSLVLHGGGQSRRLPAYGAIGKPLIPVPIFRWAQGQKLNQTLLDLQLPLLEQIMKLSEEGGADQANPSAGASGVSRNKSRNGGRTDGERIEGGRTNGERTDGERSSGRNRSLVLIASGDVLIRSDAGIEDLPEADVINFGVSIDPETAMHHGVFVCDRKQPQKLLYMLQKPSLREIQRLALDHLFFMDVGICLLSERAVRVLMRKSGWDDTSQSFTGPGNIPRPYDFYGEFGPSLGTQPTHPDPETAELTTAVVEIPGGEFYHFGRTKDLIDSSLALQTRVSDQRRIWHKHVKPHPSMFIQNSIAERSLTEENQRVWIESSFIPDTWRLHHNHCITGIPENRWHLEVPAGICLNIQPLNDTSRPESITEASAQEVQTQGTEESTMEARTQEAATQEAATQEAPTQEAKIWAQTQDVLGRKSSQISNNRYVLQFYGFSDSFRGDFHADATVFLNQRLVDWLADHRITSFDGVGAADIFSLQLFPAIPSADLSAEWVGEFLQWLMAPRPSAADSARFAPLYERLPRLSAAEILSRSDLRRQEAHRRGLRARSWPLIAKHYRRSVMYQADLEHAAREFAQFGLPLPPELPHDEEPMLLIHDAMFRHRCESYRSNFPQQPGSQNAALSHQHRKGDGETVKNIAFREKDKLESGPENQNVPENVPENVPQNKNVPNSGHEIGTEKEPKGGPESGPEGVLEGGPEVYRKRAFTLLQESILEPHRDRTRRIDPAITVYDDQIIWGRSPVRIDLAGGWTDTPPYSLIMGGAVVNAALELNGQPPIQVFIRKTDKFSITLRSIDLGLREEVSRFDDLAQDSLVGSAFAIPKAALTLSGFHPDYCTRSYLSLKEQLKHIGGGIEISFLAAIPKGSGMGTSSVLGATILGTLSQFCGLHWDLSEIGNRTLGVEQLLTTGGGWQDQYGGIMPGLKLLETDMGLDQTPKTRWLPDMLFTRREYQECLLLYYTGVTRVAKNILAEIVQGMFLNERGRFSILGEMKRHARSTFDTIQLGDFAGFGRMIARSWELNNRLDSGTSSPEIQSILDRIDDLSLGYKLPGAGGGGYLFIVAKSPSAARTIRERLTAAPPNDRARFVDMRLSTAGLQISRS